ncbi:Ubiquitin carboxyl-terminal hydrolase 16-like protein [Drosera capensis]
MLVIGDLGFQFAFLWWCVVVPAIGYVVRRRWRAAAARSEEVRRLLALASEEADRAELEARYEYGKGYVNVNGNGNGNENRIGGVHRGVVDRDVPGYSSSNCAVCFRPTLRRCSRCKAVRYWCQLFENGNWIRTKHGLQNRTKLAGSGVNRTDAMFNLEDPLIELTREIEEPLIELTREIEEPALDTVDGQPNRDVEAPLANEFGLNHFDSVRFTTEPMNRTIFRNPNSGSGLQNFWMIANDMFSSFRVSFTMCTALVFTPIAPLGGYILDCNNDKPNTPFSSGECQIFHWRKGHKDECRPPPMYSFQNDEVFLGSQHAVKQSNGGGDAVALDSRGNQHGNLGIESSDYGFELNDPTHDIPPSGDEPSRDESNFPDGGFREVGISREQNPSSLTGKLTDGCSTEVTIEKEPLKPEPTTMVQAVDNHIPSDHKGDSDGRALMNSGGASGNLLDEVVSSSQPNHNEARQGVKTSVLRSNSNRSIVNGDVSKLRSDLPISFDFSQNLSSELYSQGLKGLFLHESFVKLYNWNKVELLPSGLMNCGNRLTSNMNQFKWFAHGGLAAMPMLCFSVWYSLHPLRLIFSKNFTPDHVGFQCVKRGWCFTCDLERLVLEAKDGRSPLSPFRIISNLQKIGSHLACGKEEDAHEFLRCAVDSMQSICLHEAGVSLDSGTGSKPSSYEEETNLIGLTFGGYLRSKIRCLKCSKKSQHDERIMDLSIEIDGDIDTLEEALKRFTGTEILDGENKYHCERCNSYERAKKKLVVVEAPNILSITLKRYRPGIFGKLNKSVKFPEILNLAPYMGEPSDKSPIYRLYGVVVHLDSMNSTFSGHYICYIRNVQMKWFAIDDSSVRLVEQERVLGRDAYMLFYSRCSPRAPRSIRDSIIPRAVMSRSKHSAEVRSKAGLRVVSSRARDRSTQSQSAVSDIPRRNGPRFYMRPPNFTEADSLSDSSSIFSHSDEASSTSTDSNRDPSGTDDWFDAFFGDSRYGRNYGWRGFPDSDSSSSSSPSSSPPHLKRSPLSNTKRYASSHSQPSDANDIMGTDLPAMGRQENGGTLGSAESGAEGSFLHHGSSSIAARKLVYSSSFRETDSERLGWPNSSDDAKSSTVYLRRSSSRRVA